jgi:hypothetical protein
VSARGLGLDVRLAPADAAPRCERCGRPETDWPDFHLNEADLCASCTMAKGMQHHAPYALRARWWDRGGHCLCEECAPPRGEERCETTTSRLCAACAAELAADRAVADARPEYPGLRCGAACGHCGGCS